MKDMELISVIIPVFNTAPYLKRCMDSILNQTWTNLQIIAVDDGSTDRSGDILDEYQAKDPRVAVLHQENRGVSAARNAGLKLATGDYIGFIDSDDAAHSSLYEMLLQLAKQYDAPIAHCGYRRIAQDGSTKDISGTDTLLVQDQRQAMECLLLGKHFVSGLWNKLFHRSLVDGVFFREDIKINEDLLFVYQLFKKADKSVYLDRSLYFMYERRESATGSGTGQEKREKDLLVVAKQIAEDSQNTGYEEAAWIRYIEILAIEYGWKLARKERQGAEAIRRVLLETKWKNCRFRFKFRIKLMMLLYAPILYRVTDCAYRRLHKENWDTV